MTTGGGFWVALRDKSGQFGYEDIYTWVGMCADSKLIVSWMVGKRDAITAHLFASDLAGRLANRIQLTTDGYKLYLDAVEAHFGANIDYGMLVKIYGDSAEQRVQKRYSPAKYTGSSKKIITGLPDRKNISTSYVERQNLTMRMAMRRFTRLTNGFSKKAQNLVCAVSLHFMYYNFARVHQSLRVTPAMEAGISDHIWSIEEIVKLSP